MENYNKLSLKELKSEQERLKKKFNENKSKIIELSKEMDELSKSYIEIFDIITTRNGGK